MRIYLFPVKDAKRSKYNGMKKNKVKEETVSIESTALGLSNFLSPPFWPTLGETSFYPISNKEIRISILVQVQVKY